MVSDEARQLAIYAAAAVIVGREKAFIVAVDDKSLKEATEIAVRLWNVVEKVTRPV